MKPAILEEPYLEVTPPNIDITLDKQSVQKKGHVQEDMLGGLSIFKTLFLFNLHIVFLFLFSVTLYLRGEYWRHTLPYKIYFEIP